MSDFTRLPNQNEVAAYDPRYVSDMRLALHIYSHQSNNSTVMQLYENWLAFNDDPAAFKAHQAALRDTYARERESDRAKGMNATRVTPQDYEAGPPPPSTHRPTGRGNIK